MWKKKTPIQVWSWDLCAWKSLIHTTKKVCAFFHDPEWCHLFTLECFEQELRKPIRSLAPPLGKSHGLQQVTKPSFSSSLRRPRLCYSVSSGWDVCAVTCAAPMPCISLHLPLPETSCKLHPLPQTLTPAQKTSAVRVPPNLVTVYLSSYGQCWCTCCTLTVSPSLLPSPLCPSHYSPLFSFASVQILFVLSDSTGVPYLPWRPQQVIIASCSKCL